jgi:SsrA-binding protein
MAKVSEKSDRKIIALNKKARFNYELLENYEAGLVLTGNEIKAIRQGNITLNEAYVRVQDGELWLVGAHITEYSHSSERDYNPTRKRKLLMKRTEINRLQGRVDQKGLTIVPVSIYLKDGYAKLEVALAKGKDAPDKRKTLIEREQKRTMERLTKRVR